MRATKTQRRRTARRRKAARKGGKGRATAEAAAVKSGFVPAAR